MNSDGTSPDGADTPTTSSANPEESNSGTTNPQAVAEPDDVEADPNVEHVGQLIDWDNLPNENFENIELEDEELVLDDNLEAENHQNHIIERTVYARIVNNGVREFLNVDVTNAETMNNLRLAVANMNLRDRQAANRNAQAGESNDNPRAGPADNDDNQPSTSQ